MPAPLSSLKILDFSTLLPGPFASKTLADLGAEVLRVETSSRLDITRIHPANLKVDFLLYQSAKRSLLLKHLPLNQQEFLKQMVLEAVWRNLKLLMKKGAQAFYSNAITASAIIV